MAPPLYYRLGDSAEESGDRAVGRAVDRAVDLDEKPRAWASLISVATPIDGRAGVGLVYGSKDVCMPCLGQEEG
jgi:hypothetical protein